MSFLTGLVGCCQQGEGSAPTGVSVATSSSGNYDDSFIIDFQNGFSSGTAYTDHDGSTSGVTIFTNTWDSHYSGEGDSDMKIKAYMRATNATSYAWTGAITGTSLSNSCSAAIANDASVNNQNALVDPCLVITITHGSSRPSHPEAGDYVVFTVTGTATNSDGSTASTVTHKITWT